MPTLTKKQLLFVKEYAVDQNGTRAAKAAGYSAKTADVQASRLLANVKVRAIIDRANEKRCEKLDINADYVLQTIRDTVDRCAQAVAVTDREGNETGEWKFDSFAVLKGCELLGKHLKLFTDKTELTGKDGNAVKVILIGREALHVQ